MSRMIGRSARIVVSLEPELKKRIEEYAAANDRSASETMRLAAKALVMSHDNMPLSSRLLLVAESARSTAADNQAGISATR